MGLCIGTGYGWHWVSAGFVLQVTSITENPNVLNPSVIESADSDCQAAVLWRTTPNSRDFAPISEALADQIGM